MDEEPDRSPPDQESDHRQDGTTESGDDPSTLLQELVAYLRDKRTELREEWARRISEAELLGVMSDDEIFSEATEVYDNYVDALETGSIETLQTYARELSERIIPRGVETHEVLGIVLLLRDVLARSLFAKYQKDPDLLNRILDEYEPAANRIAVTVGVSFVEERERVIHDQQETLRECPTPGCQLRERLLILPSPRSRLCAARQLAGGWPPPSGITGPPSWSSTSRRRRRSIDSGRPPRSDVEASRLVARTPDRYCFGDCPDARRSRRRPLGMMKTVGDLQGGLEEAERLAGNSGRRHHRAGRLTRR